MNKFKVGDYVEAKNDVWYVVTTPGVLCEVVEINADSNPDMIRVKIIKPGHSCYGYTYEVDAEHFKLASVHFFNKKEMNSIINFLKEGL